MFPNTYFPTSAPTSAGGYPAEQDVREDVIFGDTSQFTGQLDLPDIADCRLGVIFDTGSKVGNVRVPPVEKVEIGFAYDTLDTLVGTLEVSAGYPAETDVRLSTIYGQTGEFTGQLDLPSVDKVRAGVEFDSLTKLGNSVQPPEARVLTGTNYGSQGAEFAGTYDPGAGGGTGYPLETEVAEGVLFGNALEFTGNRKDALESDVRLGETYGPNGTLFVGTYTGGSGTPADSGWVG